MRKHIPKIVIIFLILVGVVAWGIRYIYFGSAQRSKASGETVSFIFDPASVNQASGDFSVSVKIKPSIDMTIRGYQFGINFDKSKIQFKNIQYKTGVVSNGMGDDDSKTSVINQNGKIRVVGEIQAATGQLIYANQNTEVVTVSFTANSSQSSLITTGNTDAKFFMIKADYTLEEKPSAGLASFSINASEPTLTPTPTGDSTPTPGTSASMSLNLKIKLQGVTKKPVKADAITVQVKLAGGGLSTATAYKSVQFTVNDAGVWSGAADFDAVPTGGGYRVYIKGPKHIAKRICDAAPTESTGGAYHCADGAIVLAAGSNTFDFSNITLLAGDLPEAGGVQNGSIDAYDTTFVRTNLGSTDVSKLIIGDLNLDGIIDTQDYSMILQSLSIKFDEE